MKYNNKPLFRLPAIALIILASMLSACEQNNNTDTVPDTNKIAEAEVKHVEEPQSESDLLQKVRDRGKLIVLTTNLPTTYYINRDDQEEGPEYDMTQSFADSLQLDVEYKLYDSIKELLEALRNKEGDIAAAGLTVNDKRKAEFDFGPVYQVTNEFVVCHRGMRRLNDSSELGKIKIVVSADSSYVESIKKYPEASWSSVDGKSTVDLISKVANGSIDCTISDSTLYKIERRYFTEIQNKFTLSNQTELAWMLRKGNAKLLEAMTQWFKTYKKEGGLASMLEKYYGYVEIFDYVDTHKFLKRTKTRLPKYKNHFVDAANKNDIQPSLLAAQSYQESHWDRKAKSPTGVRGIMMLTQPVAKSLGVTNRLNAEQNIYAGAKFQAKMKKMVAHVDEPNRTWLALAAYNIGRGHFRDAQTLARQLNKDPDHWHDMKEVLPLLSKKEYYKNLRYGYARGNEPVRYVTRIRNYEELLHRHFDGVTK